MAKVRRGNVVLRVKDYEVEHYLLLGYNVIDDETGAVLRQAIPNDLGTLQTAYVENLKKIAELEDTIAKLTAKLSKPKASKKADKE